MNNQPIHFVTGGTGFLGAYLLRLLVSEGKKVRALRRPNSPMDLVQDIADQIEWVQGDILRIDTLEDAMKGVDYLYHAAAMVSFDPRKVADMMKINVAGTANVVNVALDEGIQKMVHVSSIAALGRTENITHINEKSAWQTDKLNSNYAISKFEAECEVWRAVVEGLNAVIVNPAVILGSGFWKVGSCKLFKKVWDGLKYYPVGKTGFVDVRDVALSMTKLMESDISAQRFIVNGDNLSYKNFLENIAQELGKPAPSIKATPFLRGLAWRAEKLRSLISGSSPIITRETTLTSSYQFEYDNTKIKAALNFEFTPIQKTIRETALQMKNTLAKDKNYDVLPF